MSLAAFLPPHAVDCSLTQAKGGGRSRRVLAEFQSAAPVGGLFFVTKKCYSRLYGSGRGFGLLRM